MKNKSIRVGLLGLGTVGSGVVEMLNNPSKLSKQRTPFTLKLEKILIKSKNKKRSLPGVSTYLTTHPDDIIKNPDIDLVVELIGGIGPAKQYILNALKNGKDVITANKSLIAAHGREIIACAKKYNQDVRFEASVCGGIPLLRIIQEGLIANDFRSLYGIINGTTNYILTRMTDRAESFTQALQQAQSSGLCEANYKLDTKGYDALEKIAILARIAFHCEFPITQIFREGMEYITPQDITYAAELGYRIKLLGIINRLGKKLEIRVHPAMIPAASSLAAVRDEYNSVHISCEKAGQQIFYGKGAGPYPTASAVISDIIDCANRIYYNNPARIGALSIAKNAYQLIPMDHATIQYYLRFTVIDSPGVMAQITAILAQHHISLLSVLQKDSNNPSRVPIIITTHFAKEKEVQTALKKIDKLSIVKKKTQLIRIENITDN